MVYNVGAACFDRLTGAYVGVFLVLNFLYSKSKYRNTCGETCAVTNSTCYEYNDWFWHGPSKADKSAPIKVRPKNRDKVDTLTSTRNCINCPSMDGLIKCTKNLTSNWGVQWFHWDLSYSMLLISVQFWFELYTLIFDSRKPEFLL